MNILAIICLVLYAVMVIIMLVVRQKLLNDMEISISGDATAGKLVEDIFEKFSGEKKEENEDVEQEEVVSEQEEIKEDALADYDEDEDGKHEHENEDEEYEDEDEDVYGRKHFDYNAKKREFKFESSEETDSVDLSELIEKSREEDEKINKKDKKNKEDKNGEEDEYLGTEKIKGSFKYGLDKKEGTVYMTEDIYESNSYTGVAIASYFTYKYLLSSVKPIKYRLLSLSLLIPKLIVQIGWIFPITYFFGEVSGFIDQLPFVLIVVIISLLLSLLDLLYSNYLKNYAMSELIEDGIIKENDVEGFSKTISVVAIGDLSKNFTILKWLIGKLGYKI